jgi:predicted permease
MQPTAIYRALLWCYPAEFREEYGREMAIAFAEQLTEARQARNRSREAFVWLHAAADIVTVAPKEHCHVILHDIRYALRAMASQPAFTAVAILSLALGIGANTALFSLWNGVLRVWLPVRAPEQLVMLTDPDASGVSIGSQNGQRSLLTYAEFEQLRDHAPAFSGLMASQSSLDRWQVRVQGSESEQAHGRLVTARYFDVLGVTPVLGRTFDASGDHTESGHIVISYPYWQRRFGGRADVLGKTITIRKATLSIIGVTPPGFYGETSGQQPDFWAPLRMQPHLIPGRDWLHDTGHDKVMWLHVFGRLRPGVQLAQAQSMAHSVFKSGLETYYGTVSDQRRREFLNQSLLVRPAAGGASQVRRSFSNPLQMLLGAVGVVLLIACANLANLLLARGTARRREIALRLSLGATRSRLVRQLLTESLVLAAAGGVAGLAAAYAFQRGLVWMIRQSDSNFQMRFQLDFAVLAFSVLATVTAAILFGLLPAWAVTKADAGESLKERSQSAPAGQLRWGRLLVVVQLALSVPLLVGAGLLLRTLYNLRNADLGYAREQLIVVRVDAQSAGYDMPRREPLFRELQEKMRRIHGVLASSYSENGLFSGRDSGDEIEVEGYTRTGKNDQGSRWDQVGPGYFSTVGVPILHGREIVESDSAGAPYVCVINEAFAKRFFAGRNPIGKRITTVYGDKRTTHYVAGVAANARTHQLRGEVPPRYFVPLTQPLAEFDGVVFSIRAAGDVAPVLSAVQKAVRLQDAALPVLSAQLLEERLATRMAQDRIMATLALAFGIVALVLVAIGLYGVLAYSIARRQSEIGIRIALGAYPGRVVRMILAETSTLILGGLMIGGFLAIAASRLITSQLYGLAPHDPLSLSAALAIVVTVAVAASYLPARRASRLDPMSALRQD